jgi:23S rRNA (uracil1939-C5)-methyltransferase
MKVEITDRNRDGRGRCRVGSRAVLVSQAHPGELVTVRVDKKTRGTLQGRVARLLRADPRRISHGCQHEFRCTGCPLLASPLEEEAAFKTTRARDALASAGVQPDAVLRPVVTPAGPFGYRHYSKMVFACRKGRVLLGSYVAGTHDVVANDGCPVLDPVLGGLMADVGRAVAPSQVATADRDGLRYAVCRRSRSRGESLLLLVTSESPPATAVALATELAERHEALSGVHVLVNRDSGNSLLAGELQPVAGATWITEELLGFEHRIGPRSFFQVNPQAATVLFNEALERAGRGSTCIEGYAGVGTLSLPLATRFESLVAVESSAEAADALERARDRVGLGRIEVICGRAEAELPRLFQERRAEVAVLDPPRKGLGQIVTRALAASSVRRVVLLSCDPATLAVDLPELLAAGFGVERVLPVDQFPRTGHVETCTTLSR